MKFEIERKNKEILELKEEIRQLRYPAPLQYTPSEKIHEAKQSLNPRRSYAKAKVAVEKSLKEMNKREAN